MKYCLLVLFATLSVFVYSQKVKVTSMNRDYTRHMDVAGFNCLHEEASEEMYEWIADITVSFDTLEPTTLKKLYKKMSDKGNKLGANAFRVLNSDIYISGDEKHIDLGIYYLRQERRDQNLKLFQSGKIYLFGFLGHHKKMEGYNIVVNGEKMIQRELSYKVIQPKVGTLLRIKLGKWPKADNIKLKIEPDMLPRYYRFNVFKGIFSQSVISEHEWSFGELLVRVFDKEVIVL